MLRTLSEGYIEGLGRLARVLFTPPSVYSCQSGSSYLPLANLEHLNQRLKNSNDNSAVNVTPSQKQMFRVSVSSQCDANCKVFDDSKVNKRTTTLYKSDRRHCHQAVETASLPTKADSGAICMDCEVVHASSTAVKESSSAMVKATPESNDFTPFKRTERCQEQ